jgi:hypothetical protein
MDILFIMSDTLIYPHPPDPNIDYGEPNRLDSTCAECGQVWLKEDMDINGVAPCCRPVEELDEADREWWDAMTRGCEKSHREREERE